jgi:N-methylhydantoinase B/oxoprolinase/acetone carboxylase alpha subunit
MSNVDPITLEVLRHRLMMINDEQGRVASRLSGSPVVYEAKDFNSALLTPDGDSLFIGIYMTRLSLCLSAAVKATIERFGATMTFRDGDAFVTNDPWVGAAHMNDILMYAPIFHGETLVCWTGLAMHEVDVGGPNPGSFTVGTRDVFGEAPLIPPVKMVDADVVREDVEALISRNSRTSQLNGLNMRARLAAINRTRDRIREVTAEYGLDTMMQVQRSILDLVRASFARRLRSLPDGTWLSEGFLDHDGNENRLYRIRLAMTKTGDRLKFDFTGTDKQARGAVNCTRVGLESGVFSAILPMLCYDISWSPGGMADLIDIVSEPGTVNNALHPAAVSMATVSGIFATAHVSFGAIAKMIACSSLVDEIQANWAPAWQGMTMAGHNADGRPFTAVFLDNTGGSGGRSWKDGIDAGGLAGAPAMAIGNVETYEKENPILYVFRRFAADTCGHGLYRGGVGTQVMIAPHGNTGPIDLTVLTHGASQPESQGLFGGYPSSVQVRVALRDAKLDDLFAQQRIPDGLADVPGARAEPLAAKQRTPLREGDMVLAVCAGGGGYGDPLDRPAQAVCRDVADGLVSARCAFEIYGVSVTPRSAQQRAPTVDEVATAAQRRGIRSRRLSEGRPVDPQSAAPRIEGRARILGKIGAAFHVVGAGGREIFTCQSCNHPLSTIDRDPKSGTLVRDVPMTDLSPWNRFGLTDEIRVREFCCPACAHLVAVQVARKDDAILLDMCLAPLSSGQRSAAE